MIESKKGAATRGLALAFGCLAVTAMAQVKAFDPVKAVDTGFRAYQPLAGERSVGVKVTASTREILNLAPHDPFAGAQWIWHRDNPRGKGFVRFRTRISLSAEVKDGSFAMSCDNGAVVSVNGRELVRQGNRSEDWQTITRVKSLANSGLRAGENLIEVVGENTCPGDAGLLAAFDLELADGSALRLVTDDSAWESSRDGKSWRPAHRIGEYGCAPWGVFDERDHGRNPIQVSTSTRGEFMLSEKDAASRRVWIVCDEIDGGKSAEITVNGQVAGAFSKPPHRIDIGRFVREGRNEFATSPNKLWNPRVVAADEDGLAETPHAETKGKVFGLTCEYCAEPMGVVNPRLFWKFNGERPERFALDVASAPEKLSAGDVWHGEVEKHLYVEPPLKLTPFTRYWWRVGAAGEFATASFVTGVENWSQPFFIPHWAKRPEEYWRARKTVELHGAISVVLGVCSRGYHKLFVNGREVEATFGPNRSHIEDGILLAETYDVTRFVRDGANEIEIIVADGWARVQTCNKCSCLSVEGRAVTKKGVVTIDSSKPWMTARVNDRAFGGWRFGNYGGEHLCDMRKFSDEKPGRRLEGERFRVSCDVSPRDGILKELKPVSVENVGRRMWRIDFGEQFTGFVRLRLRGKPGETATLDMSDNISTRCQFGQRWEFEFCEGGKGEFASLLNWLAGRYAYLEGVDDLNVAEVMGVAVGNFTTRTGDFRGDSDLERVMRIDNNTLLMTSFSGVTADCPHRERLGYGEATLSSMWGDGLPYFDGAAYYFANLLKWASSQEPDGHIPHVSPDATGGGGTFWSNFPIYAFADYWRMYPDARLRVVIRPVAEKWLDYLHSKVEDGLVRKYEPGEYGCLGDWAFPDANVRDWGQSREALFFNNCSYAWAILRALETEGLVPDPKRREELMHRHANIVAAVEKEFYRDGIYMAPHARYQAIALEGGVAAAFGHAAETERRMLDIVERKGYVDGGSPSYTTILRVMCRSDRGRELLLKTFRRQQEPGYLFFSNQGYTTIPEYWNYGFHSTGSMMHTCFTGGAGALIYGLAGFDVNGDEITVAPFVSPLLPNYEAHMETLYGTLALKVRAQGNGISRIEVTCPSGCRGRFRGDREEPLRPGKNMFQVSSKR